MPGPAPRHATLDDWIAHEAIPFALDASGSFDAAVDKTVAALGSAVELLGFGEPLHGGEEFLLLRNRLFERLVEAHGYGAIAIESSFPKGLVVDATIAGRGPAAYDAVKDSGFSHGFGALDANRELVEWMRHYNADPSHAVKLRFYGMDAPTEAYATASPRRTLDFVLDYVAALDDDAAQKHRQRIEPLIGADAGWNVSPMARDRSPSVGLSPTAAALRVATEDLATELRIRRPELVAKGGKRGRERYLLALQHASIARQLLSYHAALAGGQPPSTLLGIRDAMMADNLAYIAARERRRGKVLIFAHNAHLQRGKAVLPWYEFWPVGAHLDDMFGPRYAVIGSALCTSEENGIGQPEAGTLEARFLSMPGPGHFIATHRGHGLRAADIAALPTRSRSARNRGYSPLSARSFANFDCLAILRSATYTRGAPPLLELNKAPEQK